MLNIMITFNPHNKDLYMVVWGKITEYFGVRLMTGHYLFIFSYPAPLPYSTAIILNLNFQFYKTCLFHLTNLTPLHSTSRLLCKFFSNKM